LVGRAGVGKSHLVDHVATLAAADGHEVIRARATAGSSELPLGVFLTQLGAAERFLTPMFTEIRDRIVERAAGRPILLCVDDVDRLDDTSAVLIHQMVASGEAQLIATLRVGRMAPGEILDLAQRGELRRLEIGPMSRDAAAAMAEHVLGATLDEASHQRLWAATAGNPLFIREVLLSAQESAQLTRTDDGISLADLPLRSARLVDAVKGRLAHLTPELHKVLVHLAFAEPCGTAELASVADADALATLESAELIETVLDDRRISLRLTHPLYGEVLRAGTPLLQRRALLATLARDLQATGARRRSDIVKLARLAVDGGVDIGTDLLVRAASLVYHNGDHVLCERIGRKAFESSSRFDAGWELANCLYQAGELQAVRDHLPGWRATATNTAELLATAMIEAQNEFWYAGDLARAEAITDAALAAHPEDVFAAGASRDELVANLALFTALAGDPRRAWQLAEPLLAHGPDPVLIRAAVAAANALGHMARVDEAVDVLGRAIEAYEIIGAEATSLSQRVTSAVRAVANGWRGDLPAAWADSQQALDTAVSEFQISAANYATADLHLLAGRPSLARPLIERAVEWFGRSTGGSTERRWMLARLILVHATAGDLDAAEHTLAVFDADDSPGIVFDHKAEIGRARALHARGFPEEARDVLRAAMHPVVARGQVAAELFLAYELLRMDRVEEVADRMAELAVTAQGQLFPLLADHAAALVVNTADALGDVAERFAALGMPLFASEAAAQAADAARRSGEQRAATRWTTRATELRALCDDRVVAAPIVDAGPVTLTRREREIGMLAAQGLASKEIGERLFISRRTAENHIAKVYDKLGVRTRIELARVLDGGIAAVA
ncbi:MAG: LuxR C-terminal-related transcriptional regulator, partial [Ilumatobacteraceae bacterium]